MTNWKHIATELVLAPVRSAGNQVRNLQVQYEVFKDGVQYKAVPQCSQEEKIKANLKEEILFSFQLHKAVAAGGINDGNQHIVEQLGMLLKEKGMTM